MHIVPVFKCESLKHSANFEVFPNKTAEDAHLLRMILGIAAWQYKQQYSWTVDSRRYYNIMSLYYCVDENGVVGLKAYRVSTIWYNQLTISHWLHHCSLGNQTFRTIDVSYHLWTFRTMDDSYHGLFVPSSDFSCRRRNSTATNENGVKNNIRKPKRRQIKTATYILL